MNAYLRAKTIDDFEKCYVEHTMNIPFLDPLNNTWTDPEQVAHLEVQCAKHRMYDFALYAISKILICISCLRTCARMYEEVWSEMLFLVEKHKCTNKSSLVATLHTIKLSEATKTSLKLQNCCRKTCCIQFNV